MKLFKSLRKLLRHATHPSVDKCLSQFSKKISDLEIRKSLDEDSIEGAEVMIQELKKTIAVKRVEVLKATHSINRLKETICPPNYELVVDDDGNYMVVEESELDDFFDELEE